MKMGLMQLGKTHDEKRLVRQRLAVEEGIGQVADPRREDDARRCMQTRRRADICVGHESVPSSRRFVESAIPSPAVHAAA